MHCYPGDSCAMYLAYVCSFKAELMLDDGIPAGAKLY